jgi:hypothetical protein
MVGAALMVWDLLARGYAMRRGRRELACKSGWRVAAFATVWPNLAGWFTLARSPNRCEDRT